MSERLPNLAANLRALPPTVWVLVIGTFINRFGTFVVPFLLLYLSDEGFSITQSGFVLSAYGVGNFIASWFGGYFADRFGRRNTTVLSMFSSAIVMVCIPWAVAELSAANVSEGVRLASVMALTVLAGMTAELYRPASNALLTDLVPKENRVTAFAVYRLAINAGWAFGPAAAGLLAKYSFVYLFLGDAITSAAYGIVAIFFLPHGKRSKSPELARWGPALRIILRDRKFLLYACASLGIGFSYFQTHSTLALHVRDAGLSVAVYGLLHSLNGLIVILFELPLSPWTQRRPPRRMMSIGFVLVGIGFGLTAWAHDFRMLALTVVIWSIGEIISFPVGGAYVANLAPDDMRGRYMGFMGFVWSAGMILGPTLGTFIYVRSPVALWLTCGAAGLFAAVVISICPNEGDAKSEDSA